MTSDQFGSFVKRRYQHLKPNCRRRNPLFVVYGIYTVSQKKLGHFFTAYNFRNIEQSLPKLAQIKDSSFWTLCRSLFKSTLENSGAI